MNRNDIEIFLKLQPKLAITHTEISVLSKKSPNDAVNKFKLTFINSMLIEANGILKSEYRPFAEFETFSEDDIPTNSDVAFMLSPYLRGLEKLRCDNIVHGEFGKWYWQVDGQMANDLQTDPATIR